MLHLLNCEYKRHTVLRHAGETGGLDLAPKFRASPEGGAPGSLNADSGSSPAPEQGDQLGNNGDGVPFQGS